MSIKDFLLWQRLPSKGDSQTTPQPSNQGLHLDHTNGWERGFSRRRFIHAAAGATALAFGCGLSSRALARDDRSRRGEPLPEPKPIPGGSDLSEELGLEPPYDFIHTFAPGPKGVVLPFTKVPLEGLNVEPSTITDFDGATALAFVVGRATGSDGKTYNLETDFRIMEGRYVSAEGMRRHGTFALV
jgi:hypothetical protein